MVHKDVSSIILLRHVILALAVTQQDHDAGRLMPQLGEATETTAAAAAHGQKQDAAAAHVATRRKATRKIIIACIEKELASDRALPFPKSW